MGEQQGSGVWARGRTMLDSPDWAAGPEPVPNEALAPHRVLEGDTRWSHSYERDELSARAARLRKVMVVGALAWLSFLPTDLVFNSLRGADHGLTFVVIRLIATLPLLMLWLHLARRTPSRVGLLVLEGLVVSQIAGATALLGVFSGGLSSPLLAALLPILVVRAIAIPDDWRRGLPLVCAPAVTFWLVLGVGSALSSAAPPIDPATLAAVILHLGMQAVTIAMITIGGHVAWDVRRNLYKARTVGRYELLRPLGRKAMGEVWVAWHQGLHLELALKILPILPTGAGEGAVARFEREVAATTKLRHPNTVRVYDFGLTPDGLLYYAMELLEGETLAELVEREGPLPITRALSLLRQVARALDEAHQHGIVHRDIKPENLFVSTPAGERDVMKVLDFGVASVAATPRSANSGAGQSLRLSPSRPHGPAQPIERVGTPLYISPEVARGGVADPRSDIYALGCVLYFMLTASPVFVERDLQALLRAHAEQQPAPPSTLLSAALPDYVETLVMRCLAKDPEQRYADADALVRAIDLCLRLGRNDRLRGGGESQQPRVRTSRAQLEEWAKHSSTETDIDLLGAPD
ncbi:Serine/threonine protein kinase [Enhygromyxa salina]|uniref:Serine/threonine protein kinase n=1 Tax=Enhygromyxa salina TaxID=215803 RepID=A0A0C2CKQ6_9BACT|nr:serine/threonine-protein kinase [Enhygromyxa salina]KIG11786.1 Serine/threonine protein kinase [Enhygromyxa salina]